MQEKISEAMESLFVHEAGLLKRKFSDPRNDDPLSIMRELAGKDPVQILTRVFEVCMQYFSPFHRPKLHEFIQCTLNNKTLRHMFLLAIYKGAYSAEKLFPQFFEESASSLSSRGGDATGIQSYHEDQLCKSEGECVCVCFFKV